MKRKQVKTFNKGAKQNKPTIKALPQTPQKEVQRIVKTKNKVLPIKKNIVAKTSANKKNPARVQYVVEKVKEEVEDEDQVEVDDVQPNEKDGYGQLQGEETTGDEEDNEEDEENSNEDNEEDEENSNEDNEEDEENSNEDDEGPSEDAIETEEPTIPSQVKSGPIPPTVPTNKIIHIKKLPKNCKQIDIVEAFAKYGAIDRIEIVKTPINTVYANVAFKTQQAALAAIAGNINEKKKILGSFISVTKKNDPKRIKNLLDHDRTVHVKFYKKGITWEDVKQHFESCGKVESVDIITNHNSIFAYVTFADTSAIPAALKLHNSLLNGGNIRVTESKPKPNQVDQLHKDRFSVILKNIENLESIDVEKLKAIFSKCGEIDNIDIVCKKNVLAFVRFKTEEAAQKAVTLNEKTEQGIKLVVESYSSTKKNTSIYVSNLRKDCTVEDLTMCFSRAGEIEKVDLREGYAIIRFADCDGYCKSFLYNESFIRGKYIFIQPYSFRKKAVPKYKTLHNKGFKRSAKNGHSVFKPKKAKFQ